MLESVEKVGILKLVILQMLNATNFLYKRTESAFPLEYNILERKKTLEQ